MTIFSAFMSVGKRSLAPSIASRGTLAPSISRLFSAAAAISRDQVEDRILGVLRAFDRVNKDKIKIDSKFTSDLGLDSLDVVEVMIAIEEEFHMEIPDEVADKVTTPKEAADYVYEHQSAH